MMRIAIAVCMLLVGCSPYTGRVDELEALRELKGIHPREHAWKSFMGDVYNTSDLWFTGVDPRHNNSEEDFIEDKATLRISPVHPARNGEV